MSHRPSASLQLTISFAQTFIPHVLQRQLLAQPAHINIATKMMNTDVPTSWQRCVQAHKRVPPEAPSPAFLSAVHAAGLSNALASWALCYHLEHLMTLLPPLLSASTPSTLSSDTHTAHTHFINARNSLACHEKFISPHQTFVARFQRRLSSRLPASIPKQFSLVVYDVLHQHLVNVENSESGQCLSTPVVSELVAMGLTSVAQNALSWAIAHRMDNLVSARASRNDRVLPDLLSWVNRSAAPAVAALHPDAATSWARRLLFRLHQSVCDVRTSQLLHLIRSFPHSRPALEDLRDSILATDRKPFVAAALREQFRKSVLNAGTNTDRILHHYVSMIRTLRFLDPAGLIVDVVSRPILDYLRRRPDTVRCIVAGMTGDGDLYKELERGRRHRAGRNENMSGLSVDKQGGFNSGVPLSSSITGKQNIEEDLTSIDGDLDEDLCVCTERLDSWRPIPAEAPRGDSSASAGDAIATLVTIYGSSEHIVAEYRAALADKLLNSFEVELSREERVLALLSDRFGSDPMHYCSIMVRDVGNSRESVKHIQKTYGERLDNFDVTIISKEFWPTLTEEAGFTMPESVQKKMDMFSRLYERGVGRRKLKWEHGLGVVQMRLRFDDGREKTVCVSPMQAAILEQFASSSRRNLSELKSALGAKDNSILRRKVQSLCAQGLLRCVDAKQETYETVEDGQEMTGVVDDEGVEGDGSEEETGAASEAAEMAVYESYVMAMLQNLKQLSLEQIHNMLQRFVQTPVYDKTPAQLASFLNTLVANAKVEVAAGMYKVKK